MINAYKFVCLILFAYCFSEAPVGTNTIMVRSVSMEKVQKKLSEQGFKIYRINRQSDSLQTDFKPVQTTISHISLIIRIVNGNAVVKGLWWTNLAPPKGDFYKSNLLMVVSQSNSVGIKSIFNVMDNFSKSLGKKIEYKRE